MKAVAIACAWCVCLGICVEAANSRPFETQPISTAASQTTTQSAKPPSILPQVTLPQVSMPQVSMPEGLLPPSGLAQPARAPDPRSTGQNTRRVEPPRGRTCFSQTETRENIASHRLTAPIEALRAGRLQGEALRARLCRWNPDEFVYEVSVLRRDGRVVHIYMNARNGQSVGAFNDNDRR